MRAIVNFSTTKYLPGQERLKMSLELHSQNIPHFMYYSNSDYSGRNMYMFKPRCIEKLADLGYTSILWLDASMVCIRDTTPLFEYIEKKGYFFQYSGWKNKPWTNERARRYFGTDEGRMMSSGVLGLDLKRSISREFFSYWDRSAKDGIFYGSHSNHRHDQTAASLIAHKLGMSLTPNNTFWNYGKEPKHNKIILLADGIC